MIQTLSVFRPTHPKYYTVINDTIVTNSMESSESRFKKSREWTDTTTMYVMLQYKKWQMKDRKTVSLNAFHQQCVDGLFMDLGINKTATQVRDKVNNTRSSYHNILKQMQKGHFQWTQDKHLSMTKTVFNFMAMFFDSKAILSVEAIDKKLSEIVSLNQ